MTIAIDFDGTVVEHRFPLIGKPLPFAFEALRALNSDGHHLILWTNREGEYLKEAIDYCRANGVEFYAVNSEYPDSKWEKQGDPRKLIADIYIDDRNIGGLYTWPEMYRMISSMNVENLSGQPGSHHHHHNHNRGHHRHGKSSIKDFFERLVRRCRAARDSFQYK